jgi:hypothetical protein
MARKQSPEVEILPPEDQPKRTRKKLVEAKHTITYEAPVPVEVEDADNLDDGSVMEFDGEIPEEAARKRKRKTAKNERDDLRREMDKYGVAATSSLRLSIEKYRHSDGIDSGTLAEKEFCTKYGCAKDHILNDDYMDVARRFGPGRYWFTLRLDNKIVRMWERQISAAIASSPIVQHAIPGDPTSPQVIVQMPENGQSQAVPFDPVKQMREQAAAFKLQMENFKLMREAFGDPVQPQQPAALSDELSLAAVLLKDPANAKRMAQKLLGDEGEQSLMASLVENGPAIIKAAGDVIRTIIADFAQMRSNGNGQQYPQETIQPANSPATANARHLTINPDQSAIAAEAAGNGANAEPAIAPERQVLMVLFGESRFSSTAEYALNLLIEGCANRTPPQVVAERLLDVADTLTEQAPQFGISGYLPLLTAVDAKTALEWLAQNTQNGNAVIRLEHAEQWTSELQAIIKGAMSDETGDN